MIVIISSSIKWNVICFHIISQIQRSIAVNQNIDNISKMDQKSSMVSLFMVTVKGFWFLNNTHLITTLNKSEYSL